jgi:hypothetical protein
MAMALSFINKAKGVPEGDPDPAVLALLDEALAQRSKFHLALDASVTGIGDLSASLTQIGAKDLTLELSGIKRVPDSWFGASVSCYFQLADRKVRIKLRYYQFNSRIVSTSTRNDIALIRISLPEKIIPGQRRKSLRVRADIARFEYAAIWSYEGSGAFDLKKPLIAFANFRAGLAVIENLSAGGMRLTLKYALLRGKGLVPEKNARFILHLALAGDSSPANEPFWILAKVNNVVGDYVTKDVSLGLEFAVEGALDPATGKVRWKKVQDNAIERLAQTTYLWHVEFYRDKGFIDV